MTTSLTEWLRSTRSASASSTSSPPGDRLRSKLEVFWRFTQDLAGLSTCRRLRVGCLVMAPDFTEILAIGYNGPPAGIPNDACRGGDQGQVAGACGCVHGEASALVKVRRRESGLVLLCTDSPCEACASLILNARAFGLGIDAVIYGREYRLTAGVELLRRGGVVVTRMTDVLGERGDDAR